MGSWELLLQCLDLLSSFTDLGVCKVLPLYIFSLLSPSYYCTASISFINLVLYSIINVNHLLSFGRFWVTFGVSWSWLLSNMGQMLDSSHRSHFYSPLATKTLSCKCNTIKEWTWKVQEPIITVSFWIKDCRASVKKIGCIFISMTQAAGYNLAPQMCVHALATLNAGRFNLELHFMISSGQWCNNCILTTEVRAFKNNHLQGLLPLGSGLTNSVAFCSEVTFVDEGTATEIVQGIWQRLSWYSSLQIKEAQIWQMDHSVDKELSEWLYSKSCRWHLSVYGDTGDEWCF